MTDNTADRDAAFEREERFIVIKRKHLTPFQESSIRNQLDALEVPTVECVVVESDWPEYETVWRMIEQRVRNTRAGIEDGIAGDALLEHAAECLANFARDRFANTKELTWATMGESSQQYFRDAATVVRDSYATAPTPSGELVERWALVIAESYNPGQFSDNGRHIHKWDFAPFGGAVRYTPAYEPFWENPDGPTAA